jgi:hypothetical protein
MDMSEMDMILWPGRLAVEKEWRSAKPGEEQCEQHEDASRMQQGDYA